MAFKYVIAILQPEVVPALEAQPACIGVGGITLSRVKGFGADKNVEGRTWAAITRDGTTVNEPLGRSIP